MSSRLSGLQPEMSDNGTSSDGVVCRAEPLTTGNIGRRLAAVHKVLRSSALQTPMNGHSELQLVTLRNNQPVKQMCQAAVELVSFANFLSCCIQHTLKTISVGLWRPGQHSVAAINTGWDEGMYQCLCRLTVKQVTNSSNLTKPLKARWTCIWNVLVSAEIRWNSDTEVVYVISGCDGLVSEPSWQSAANKRSRTVFGTDPEKFCLFGVQLEPRRELNGEKMSFEVFPENGKHWNCFLQL